MQELVAQLLNSIGDAAFEVLQSEVLLGFGLRSNQVGHCLGLREVHLAVEKRTLSELTGSGHPYARFDKRLHHRLLDIYAAVAGYLYRIFARE